MAPYSLRYKLVILYFYIIVIPILIISIAMPNYYRSMLEKETTRLTENTMVSISKNINGYLDDLSSITVIPYFNENLMLALQLIASGQFEASSRYTQLTAIRAIYNLPNYLVSAKNMIQSTVLLTMDGTLYVNTRKGKKQISNYPFALQHWYQKAVEQDGKAAFIPIHRQDYTGGLSEDEAFSVARLIKDPQTRRPVGVVMADAGKSTLDQIFDGITFSANAAAAVFDDRGDVFYASKAISPQLAAQLRVSETTVKDGDAVYTAVSRNIGPSNWKLVVLLPEAEIKAKIRWFFIVGIIFSLSGLLLTFILFSIISHWIIKPYKEMLKAMHLVEQGNLEIRMNIAGQDEIARLGNAFNKMVSRIDELINRELRAQLNQRNAEYYALQSQIQPHFLYNTLYGFIGLNRIGEHKKLELAILSLSSLLRYSLEHAERTTLAQEFAFLQRYGELQQMRFQERLAVELELEEAVENHFIPKLLLQPLVENAIIHGIEPCRHPCKVVVSARRILLEGQPFLSISVKDNGVGFEADGEEGHHGVGLANVRERITMVCPGTQWSVESGIGRGTRITITIPEEEVRTCES